MLSRSSVAVIEDVREGGVPLVVFVVVVVVALGEGCSLFVCGGEGGGESRLITGEIEGFDCTEAGVAGSVLAGDNSGVELSFCPVVTYINTDLISLTINHTLG